jgi:hypothetical protein
MNLLCFTDPALGTRYGKQQGCFALAPSEGPASLIAGRASWYRGAQSIFVLQFFSREFDYGKSEENQYPVKTACATSFCWVTMTTVVKIIARGEPSLNPALYCT